MLHASNILMFCRCFVAACSVLQWRGSRSSVDHLHWWQPWGSKSFVGAVSSHMSWTFLWCMSLKQQYLFALYCCLRASLQLKVFRVFFCSHCFFALIITVCVCLYLVLYSDPMADGWHLRSTTWASLQFLRTVVSALVGSVASSSIQITWKVWWKPACSKTGFESNTFHKYEVSIARSVKICVHEHDWSITSLGHLLVWFDHPLLLVSKA